MSFRYARTTRATFDADVIVVRRRVPVGAEPFPSISLSGGVSVLAYRTERGHACSTQRWSAATREPWKFYRRPWIGGPKISRREVVFRDIPMGRRPSQHQLMRQKALLQLSYASVTAMQEARSPLQRWYVCRLRPYQLHLTIYAGSKPLLKSACRKACRRPDVRLWMRIDQLLRRTAWPAVDADRRQVYRW